MKYQYGSEYHTDTCQKLSRYKDHLTRNLATNAALLNMVMTAKKSQQGCHLTQGTSLQYTWDAIQN